MSIVTHCCVISRVLFSSNHEWKSVACILFLASIVSKLVTGNTQKSNTYAFSFTKARTQKSRCSQRLAWRDAPWRNATQRNATSKGCACTRRRSFSQRESSRSVRCDRCKEENCEWEWTRAHIHTWQDATRLAAREKLAGRAATQTHPTAPFRPTESSWKNRYCSYSPSSSTAAIPLYKADLSTCILIYPRIYPRSGPTQQGSLLGTLGRLSYIPVFSPSNAFICQNQLSRSCQAIREYCVIW